MFRSTDPKPKRWRLLSRAKEEVELEEGDISNAAISVSVDGSKYV